MTAGGLLLLQACQVLTVALLSPLLQGAIAKGEALLQSRRGPSVIQPYRDLVKLARKGMTIPETASWAYLLGPVVAVAAYLAVPLLLPVLTAFPLPLATAGDVLGGAFLLSLAAVSVATAAADSGAPYTGLGSSRTMTFAALAEPTLIFVFFTIALLTATDNPFVMNQAMQSSWGEEFRASHALATAAFFMMLLLETGRIPIESGSATLELGMIDEARTLEHSGPLFGLLRWGGMLKQLILYTIFLNVLIAPWGVATNGDVLTVLLALGSFLLKLAVLAVIVVGIESAFAKLRLFRITEFMGAGFILAVLAILVFYFGGG
ncbi:MAG: respiratory chain complex I subunit 1 family protein [Candidatus Dormibacteraceae bacterium]